MREQDQIAVEADIVADMADNESFARGSIGDRFAIIWRCLLSTTGLVKIESCKEEGVTGK